MGVKKFGIKTYNFFQQPVVEYKKKVYDKDGHALHISPGKSNPEIRDFTSFGVDIHEIEGKEKSIPIRELTDSIAIELIPDWVDKDDFDETIRSIINESERPEEILRVAIRLVCPKLNYVIDSRKISLDHITEKKPIKFSSIDLNDVVDKVEVQSELIRVKNTNPRNSQLYFAIH